MVDLGFEEEVRQGGGVMGRANGGSVEQTGVAGVRLAAAENCLAVPSRRRRHVSLLREVVRLLAFWRQLQLASQSI
jgi:hypothetical protein